MKLWIDDVREPPEGYVWCTNVNSAKITIQSHEYLKKIDESYTEEIDLIDLDHDAGEYYKLGGDYIKLLDWLEATGRNYPIRIHSMNPVGRENMRAIIRRNGWTEVT